AAGDHLGFADPCLSRSFMFLARSMKRERFGWSNSTANAAARSDARAASFHIPALAYPSDRLSWALAEFGLASTLRLNNEIASWVFPPESAAYPRSLITPSGTARGHPTVFDTSRKCCSAKERPLGAISGWNR